MRHTTLRDQSRRIARAYAPPIVGCVAGVLIAAVVTLLLTPTYAATASVLLVPEPSAVTGQFTINEVNLALSLTTSAASVAESADVAAAVADELGLGFDAVADHIAASTTLGSQLVSIRATSDDAATAAAIANAVAREVATTSNDVGLGGTTVRVEALDQAIAPPHAESPRPLLNLALGALVGTLAGVVVLAVRRHLHPRLRSLGEVERVTGLPVFGAFPGTAFRRRPGADAPSPDAAARAETGRLAAHLSIVAGDKPRFVVTGVNDEAAAIDAAALVRAALGDAANADVKVAPAALAGAGLSPLVRDCDVLLLTVDSDRTEVDDAARAAMLVRHLGAAVTGLVVFGSAAERDGWDPDAWSAAGNTSRGRPGDD